MSTNLNTLNRDRSEMAANEDKHITVQAWLKHFCFCSDSITLLIGKKIQLKKKATALLDKLF